MFFKKSKSKARKVNMFQFLVNTMTNLQLTNFSKIANLFVDGKEIEKTDEIFLKLMKDPFVSRMININQGNKFDYVYQKVDGDLKGYLETLLKKTYPIVVYHDNKPIQVFAFNNGLIVTAIDEKLNTVYYPREMIG